MQLAGSGSRSVGSFGPEPLDSLVSVVALTNFRFTEWMKRCPGKRAATDLPLIPDHGQPGNNPGDVQIKAAMKALPIQSRPSEGSTECTESIG